MIWNAFAIYGRLSQIFHHIKQYTYMYVHLSMYVYSPIKRLALNCDDVKANWKTTLCQMYVCLCICKLKCSFEGNEKKIKSNWPTDRITEPMNAADVTLKRVTHRKKYIYNTYTHLLYICVSINKFVYDCVVKRANE